ncbi:MAG TPA: class I SAM-dependent methyltransferase [Acidobacteriaceae bacterium]|jgi:SAM-dependent methyltransferase
MDMQHIAPTLRQTPEGWWIPPDAVKEVSYPSEGNALFFAIEESSFWFAHRNQCILEAMQQFPPTGIMLDIGGGNGFVATAIQQAGYEVALVEPGIHGVQNAVKRGVRQVIHGTSDEAGILPGSAGGVGLFDVVEHIQGDQGFLTHIGQLLTPEGRVYITVPAYSWLWSHEDVLAGHARRYTLTSLSRVLKRAGFTIEYATYFFSFLPPPSFIGRALPYRLGRAKPVLSEDNVRSEHELSSPLAKRILSVFMDWELRRIAARRIVPTGGSCLVIARKT